MTDPVSPEPVYGPIAAFAGQLAAHGVRDIVISPGSRSTPLSLAFHAHPELRTHIQLDERSAAFFALGQAKASGRPSVLICTSGTAAANYLPAVVEANHACVPMIVCTADRPPELRGWGAGQTIDQVGMFTTNVRWATDLPVPSDWTENGARMAATRAFEHSTGRRRGPVHLNWPLRKPLEPVASVPVREYPEPNPDVDQTWTASFSGDHPLHGIERGVILVGPDAELGIKPNAHLAEAIHELGAAVGWPVIAEPLSMLRYHESDVLLANAEHLLKHHALVDELRPDAVLRFGGAPTTGPVNQWLERVQPEHVAIVDPERRWHDASFTTTIHLTAPPQFVAKTLARRISTEPGPWLERWRELDAAAGAAVDAGLAAGGRSSGSVVRDLCSLADDDPLFVMSSNSMPPRDLDSFVPAETHIGFFGNRGAAGIDGITSTALGITTQVEDSRVIVFTGDLALLHDIGGLLGVERAGQRLTVVCIDNDGGQIFSMLPIHGRIDPTDYETIFRTPHGVDLAQLQGLAGIDVTVVDEDDDLVAVLQASTAKTEPGVDLVIVRIDPEHDMAVRRSIKTAVGEAITG